MELFIYTNSSYEWTNTSLVYNIEKAFNLKFNKPYFTREKSDKYNNKLLSNIYTDIINNLSKRYPSLNDDKYKEIVFNTRFIMIDDRKDVINDFPNKQIVCPEYNYYSYYDIEEKLLNKYNIPKEIFNNIEVLECFDNNFLPIYNINGNDFQKDKSMVNIIELYQNRKMEIANKKQDTFFYDLIKILEKEDTVLNDKTIEKINKEIQKNLQ